MLSENNKDFNYDFEEVTCSAEPKDEKEILFKVGKKKNHNLYSSILFCKVDQHLESDKGQ